jgi:hypothetical protein
MIRAHVVVGLLAAALIVACATANAQQQIQGTWTVSPGYDSNHVELELRTGGGQGSYHDQSSDNVALSDLGLNQSQLASSGGHVTFALRRDAGNFAFEGWIGQDGGLGRFTFDSNPRYADELNARGYAVDEPRKLMTAALIDLSIRFIDDVAATGIHGLSFDKLVALRALRADAPYVRSMQAHFGDVDAETVISLRALNVTDKYVAEMKSAGFSSGSAQDVIAFRALHVDPAYVDEMASVGYTHLSAHDLVQLRALGIDAAYVRRVQAHGFRHLTVQQLIQTKAMGVI